MRLIVTNSVTKVEGNEQDQAMVSASLRYLVPNADAAIKRSGRSGWDGYKSIHDRRSKTFPSGLLSMVVEFLAKAHYRYEVVDTRACPGPPRWPVQLNGIEFRGYQNDAINAALTSGQGILQLATGAGKTEVAVALTKAIGLPTIFLTHRVNLLYQSAERFAKRWPECKRDIGIVGDGNMQFGDITFATVQTLHSAIKRYGKEAAQELTRYRMMIIDEAHRVGAAQFWQTARLLGNAYWRFGLTATPFMSDNPADSMHLLGAVGNVIHRVSATELINAGVLARPFFKFNVMPPDKEVAKLRNWRDIYEKGIVYNDHRNRVIVDSARQLVGMGYNPLVIVSELAHGRILEQAMTASGLRVRLVTGADDVRTRVKALSALAGSGADVIVCSNIFDEGVDVKDVSAIILAAGTKSAPALFQRTGRAIRKKDDGGNAVVVDFIDRQHRTLERHSLMRYSLVKSEPGFTII